MHPNSLRDLFFSLFSSSLNAKLVPDRRRIQPDSVFLETISYQFHSSDRLWEDRSWHLYRTKHYLCPIYAGSKWCGPSYCVPVLVDTECLIVWVVLTIKLLIVGTVHCTLEFLCPMPRVTLNLMTNAKNTFCCRTLQSHVVRQRYKGQKIFGLPFFVRQSVTRCTGPNQPDCWCVSVSCWVLYGHITNVKSTHLAPLMWGHNFPFVKSFLYNIIHFPS
jgi:hypothetical protein